MTACLQQQSTFCTDTASVVSNENDSWQQPPTEQSKQALFWCVIFLVILGWGKAYIAGSAQLGLRCHRHTDTAILDGRDSKRVLPPMLRPAAHQCSCSIGVAEASC
ncbi:hypothetical protein WJX82_003787 [Trebouxia sp. C0006]